MEADFDCLLCTLISARDIRGIVSFKILQSCKAGIIGPILQMRKSRH